MNKTTKIILWSLLGVTVVAGTIIGVRMYKKAQTRSADAEKNDRQIKVVINK